MVLNDAKVTKLIKTLEKAAIEKRDVTIDEIISNPISCGYLLDFCQKSYCAENLHFFMAVDKFKDECSLLDLNDPLGIQTCKDMADQIWADYLSHNSPNEVSLPSEDREVTLRRMKSPAEYGGKLFDVATQDAIKTLQRDTLGRFLKSSQFNEMADKLKSVQAYMAQAENETYEIVRPSKTSLTEDRLNGPLDFTIEEILTDQILFTEMVNYLEKKFKAENIKCARQIHVFEDLASEKKPDELKDFAWDIYLNFIVPGCAYEVSCSNLDRKSVQLRLGCPLKCMFSAVKDGSIFVLKQDLKAFCQSIHPRVLKDHLKEEQGSRTSPLKGGFFNRVRKIF